MPNNYLPPVIQTPSSLNITAITQSLPMTITVTPNSDQINSYIIGQAIKLFIPNSYNMYQADNLVGTITDISGSTFTLNLDSTQFDPFVIPSSGEQPATISPNGSRNYQYTNGSSLAVPFQSFNNIGN